MQNVALASLHLFQLTVTKCKMISNTAKKTEERKKKLKHHAHNENLRFVGTVQLQQHSAMVNNIKLC